MVVEDDEIAPLSSRFKVLQEPITNLCLTISKFVWKIYFEKMSAIVRGESTSKACLIVSGGMT